MYINNFYKYVLVAIVGMFLQKCTPQSTLPVQQTIPGTKDTIYLEPPNLELFSMKESDDPYDDLDTMLFQLNKDTIPELLITKPNSEWCGATGNCSWLVVDNAGFTRGYIEGGGVEVDTTHTQNGYYYVISYWGSGTSEYRKIVSRIEDNLEYEAYYIVVYQRNNDALEFEIVERDTNYYFLKTP
ncbi:MAG: hypothetical protein R2798_05720 [Chitinophagales bacterium]|nr:hypothetical protein [Bacteroidota bacterium]MCB9042585.1 hypothetical protein [Chitinophagales bacterium]